MTFPERLYSLRIEKGLSMKKLADRVGIYQNSICNYESGKTDPSASVVCWLADYFHVTTDYLLGRSDKRNV